MYHVLAADEQFARVRVHHQKVAVLIRVLEVDDAKLFQIAIVPVHRIVRTGQDKNLVAR